jgi:hypothetical protein
MAVRVGSVDLALFTDPNTGLSWYFEIRLSIGCRRRSRCERLRRAELSSARGSGSAARRKFDSAPEVYTLRGLSSHYTHARRVWKSGGSLVATIPCCFANRWGLSAGAVLVFGHLKGAGVFAPLGVFPGGVSCDPCDKPRETKPDPAPKPKRNPDQPD